jgi:hypothetical protein
LHAEKKAYITDILEKIASLKVFFKIQTVLTDQKNNQEFHSFSDVTSRDGNFNLHVAFPFKNIHPDAYTTTRRLIRFPSPIASCSSTASHENISSVPSPWCICERIEIVSALYSFTCLRNNLIYRRVGNKTRALRPQWRPPPHHITLRARAKREKVICKF